MGLFKKTKSIQQVKEATEQTSLVSGEFAGVKWQIVLGRSEKFGKNLQEVPGAAFRFNNGNSQIVGIFKDKTSLEDYQKKLEVNRKFISENLPKLQVEYQRIIEKLKGKGASKSELDSVKTPESRVYGHLPYPPRQLADSSIVSFAFELSKVHGLITEAKAKFERGEIPKIYCLPYWDSARGYQPLLKLEFTNSSRNPSINLNTWEPKLGPML